MPRLLGRVGLLSALTLSALFSFRALAIVNVERASHFKLQEGLGGFFDLRLANDSGNVSRLAQTIEGGLTHQVLFADDEMGPIQFKRRISVVSNYAFEKARGVRVKNRSFSHLRWTQNITRRWGWDGFLQHQADEFARLEFRGLVGAGARVQLVRKEQSLSWLGLALMYEHERIEDLGRTVNDALRLTSYIAFEWAPRPDEILIMGRVYYQPNTKDFSDFRILANLEPTFKVNDWLSTGVSYELEHDSKPPVQVLSTDERVKTFVRLTF